MVLLSPVIVMLSDYDGTLNQCFIKARCTWKVKLSQISSRAAILRFTKCFKMISQSPRWHILVLSDQESKIQRCSIYTNGKKCATPHTRDAGTRNYLTLWHLSVLANYSTSIAPALVINVFIYKCVICETDFVKAKKEQISGTIIKH